MRLFARILSLGCALVALPLAQGGGGAQATPITVPPQVSATSWALQTQASPSTSTNAFAGFVSCVDAGFCVAVGNQGPNASATTLGEVLNGSAWTVVRTADAMGSISDYLEAVSCVSRTFCMAVGINENAADSYVAMGEVWNGSAWSLVPMPSPSTDMDVAAVSCTSSTFCVAVGSSGGATAVVEEWNGTTWSLGSVPTPAGYTSAELNDVTCIGTGWCMAAGEGTVSGVVQPLAETWNGSVWTGSPTENVPGTTFAYLLGISCAGPTFCETVGESDTASGNNTLIETWNGSSWSITPSPNDGTEEVQLLAAVDCISATSCAVVGRSGPSGSAEIPFTENWDGSTWSIGTIPAPSGATSVGLNSISCITDWACVAGGFATTAGITQPYAISAPIARSGYRFVASDGGVFNYGTGAPFLGSMGGQHLNKPIVGMATMPAGDGYYLVASDGGIFTYGSAQFYGSTGSIVLNKPVVGMAVTADGAGYWLVASDGGIFSYGDAQFYGSTGSIHLNKPIVGMAATPDGKGYYMVASDGGIFNYGDAAFLGSAGSLPLNKPVVGMSVPTSGGYYLVATDGGIFTYPTSGGPPFYGSTGSIKLNKPIVGMTAVAGGYYLSGSDGGVFTYPTSGGPTFYGSTGSIVLNAPIVGIAG